MLKYRKCTGYCFLLIICLFFACSEDEQEKIYDSQIELATICDREGQFYFLLDNGKTILPDRKIDSELDLNDNRRVRVLFSVVQENAEGFEAIATIHSLAFVQVLPILRLSPEKEPQWGNDSIGVESIWIGSHYLNFSFYVYADSKMHSVNLLQTKSAENDSIYLEIRHNANEDFPAYRKKGIISFDLEDLEKQKPVHLAITVNTYSGKKTYYRKLN